MKINRTFYLHVRLRPLGNYGEHTVCLYDDVRQGNLHRLAAGFR